MYAANSSERVADFGVGRALSERAIVFRCEDDELVGILTPAEAPRRRGVVVVVGGPQYRAGSHRQFTLLARRLAIEGYPTFRFDYRGMGDSEGTPREFDAIDADINAAITAFRRALPDVQDVVLWGLCDGASAAIMFGASHPSVKGMIVLNPWVRSATTLARAHVWQYYPQRFKEREFWAKLFSGRIRIGETVGSLFSNLRRTRRDHSEPAADFTIRMRRGLANFPGRTLLVLSGNDLVARELVEIAAIDPQWEHTLASDRIQRITIPDADHTFSRIHSQRAVEEHTLECLASW